MSTNNQCFRGANMSKHGLKLKIPKSNGTTHVDQGIHVPSSFHPSPQQKQSKITPEKAQEINEQLMDPKNWGKEQWIALHTHAACASDILTEDEKAAWQNMLESFPFILACKSCCKHFDAMLEQFPVTDEVLHSKQSLSHYLFQLHNKVNKRLGKPEKTLDFLAERFGILIEQ